MGNKVVAVIFYLFLFIHSNAQKIININDTIRCATLEKDTTLLISSSNQKSIAIFLTKKNCISCINDIIAKVCKFKKVEVNFIFISSIDYLNKRKAIYDMRKFRNKINYYFISPDDFDKFCSLNKSNTVFNSDSISPFLIINSNGIKTLYTYFDLFKYKVKIKI